MTTITLRASLRFNVPSQVANLRQEFPLGILDEINNTVTFTINAAHAKLLLQKYDKSMLYTLVEVE